MFEQFIENATAAAGKIADKFGRFKDNAGNVLPSHIRSLYPAEMTTISQVFGTSLTSANLRITNGKGADGRPWCSPSLVLNQFLLHMGQGMYDQNLGGTHFLIHEATHAWQGRYGALPFSYLAGSAHCQSIALIDSGLANSNGAYNYDGQENLQFFEYNIEQQGQLVAHWFSVAGRAQGDWRFRYIRDNIRTGKPDAISEEITPSVYLPRATFQGKMLDTSLFKKIKPKDAPKAIRRSRRSRI